jgi:nitrogen fixation NifU-like protein
MTMKLKGKTRDDAMSILRAFQSLVTGGGDDAPPELGDLRLLRGVRKFPQRVKCAMLSARAAEQALQQTAGETTVSTEVEG